LIVYDVFGCVLMSAKFKRLYWLLCPQHSTSRIWTERVGNSWTRLLCWML